MGEGLLISLLGRGRVLAVALKLRRGVSGNLAPINQARAPDLQLLGPRFPKKIQDHLPIVLPKLFKSSEYLPTVIGGGLENILPRSRDPKDIFAESEVEHQAIRELEPELQKEGKPPHGAQAVKSLLWRD